MFRTFLEYKLAEQGKHLIYVDKWFPSSKTCCHCGGYNKDLALKDREWICPHCGQIVHRDKSAAINIKQVGLRQFNAKAQLATLSIRCICTSAMPIGESVKARECWVVRSELVPNNPSSGKREGLQS